MYFDFSPEQYMLRDSAREFIQSTLPLAQVRQVIAGETGFDRGAWRGLAELGLLGAMVPEAYGGAGLTLQDLALVLEESGRGLLPGPLVESAVAVPTALLAAGTEGQKRQWLSGIASGETVATVALTGSEGLALPAGIGVQATPSGAGWRLEGEVLWAPFGNVADLFLVAARSGQGSGSDGVSLFLLTPGDAGVSLTALNSLDHTTRLSHVRLTGVQVGADRLLGAAGQGWPVLAQVLQAASTAVALQAVGGAGALLDTTVAYAKDRQQFGKPIGSFQAIKHKLADMYMQYETTRSGAYYAAMALSDGTAGAAEAASMAKAACCEMYTFVAGEAIQIHGGNGFTWEYDIHFYYKRAKYLEFAFGTPTEHREAVAALCIDAAR